MKIAAIVLAAGNSVRFNSKESKQCFLLKGKPVFSYSLTAFNNCKAITDLIVVTNKECIDEINSFIKVNKMSVSTVLGGKTRQESVKNGLAALKNYKEKDFVIIHDAARPLLTNEIIENVIEEVKKNKAVTTFINVEDTIAVSKTGDISTFVDRSSLAKIQTPQAFEYELICKAHKCAKDSNATDDCTLVMNLGTNVKLIQGSKQLIKLTTQEDLKILEAFIK